MSVTKGTLCGIHETSVAHKRGAPRRVEKQTDVFKNEKGEVVIHVSGRLVNISTVTGYSNFEVVDGDVMLCGEPSGHRCMHCYQSERPLCFFDSHWREKVPRFDIDLPKAEIKWRSRT